MIDDLLIALVENDDDLLDVVPLMRGDYSEALGYDITLDVALDKVLYMKEGGGDFWIVRQRGMVVGYAMGKVMEDGSYRSDGIFVSPDFRNRGIGTLLEQSQIDYAKELGCPAYHSTVEERNQPSRRVQEKLGLGMEKVGMVYFARLALKG